jgi:hypothetical protein
MKHRLYDPLNFVPPPHIARELLAESRARTRRLEILASLSEQLHTGQSDFGETDGSPNEEAPSCPL